MATIQDLNNATAFASPVADASFASFVENPFVDNIIQTLGGLSGWQIALTIFLGLVVYDQGTLLPPTREARENTWLTN